MMISVKSVTVSGAVRKPQKTGLEKILPALYSEIKSFLRDIDLIGPLGDTDRNSIFVLLAMTDEKGAAIARERLRKKLNDSDCQYNLE